MLALYLAVVGTVCYIAAAAHGWSTVDVWNVWTDLLDSAFSLVRFPNLKHHLPT